ncbi:hypothetical protein RhiirC2_754312 [Rhizophagus irregularis]|uniref:Uncharacterized protein n=1 Tax=Rhizophagus irregularis TaxID=588596 RepID=A0A2N1MWC0_9GLOM|nr:hypothetical protein RhiirC2_754312 [Rhizophagus irregularis]
MVRFGKDFEGDQGMKDMHENVTYKYYRRMSEGFKQRFCVLCYPCEENIFHVKSTWKSMWNYVKI